MKKITLLMAFLFISTVLFAADSSSRYFYSGDGKINIASKNGGAFSGQYRNADGSYNATAVAKIAKLYGAPPSKLDMRFVEFLDYISDKLGNSGKITIHSGYRSPSYNMSLHNSGKLAAKASLHQYAMAADVKINGVASKDAWDYIRELGFGGAGYYHGSLIHIDTGPFRFWDETSSKVDTDISDDNKLIVLVADRDIYMSGETISLKFIRMTAFPIGVNKTFTLEKKEGSDWKKAENFEPSGFNNECSNFSDIDSMSGFKWKLPNKLKSGRYKITSKFCDNEWEAMPKEVSTAEFEVK